ncbi:MAG: hypothetical protein LBU75_13530 [Desulfovibrio sp.]|jgi:hypothetical protein|nr:hypothetical protein [Desulfovibrio sp.]
MANKNDLQTWLLDALDRNDGKGTIPQLCKLVWEMHRDELEQSGELFYTWQYDIRWAAQELRNQGILKDTKLLPKGVWALARSKQLP